MRALRTLLAATLPCVAALLLAGAARAAEQPQAFHVGYQKSGILVVARNRQVLEKRLVPQGVPVEWVEFTSGPPLLEAMNAGSIDLGLTGDTPPVFAQAAGAAITYVAALAPNGPGEAIIVRTDSPIRALADLKGKRIGFKRGSSSNNLVAVALEKAGVPWGAATPLDLTPADGAAAFDRGSVDAWAIWDPFLAVAQKHYDVRVLASSGDLLKANTFLLANRGFAARYPATLREAVAGLGEAAAWAQEHPAEVADAVHAVTGVEPAALQLAASRAAYYVHPMDDEVIRNQQATADRLKALGLIPKAVVIRDAVWNAPQS